PSLDQRRTFRRGWFVFRMASSAWTSRYSRGWSLQRHQRLANVDGFPPSAPRAGALVEPASDFGITHFATILFEPICAQLIPIAFDQQRLTFGAIGTLVSNIIHVANIDVLQAARASDIVGGEQRLLRRG